jgi:hypothetical protein
LSAHTSAKVPLTSDTRLLGGMVVGLASVVAYTAVAAR